MQCDTCQEKIEEKHFESKEHLYHGVLIPEGVFCSLKCLVEHIKSQTS